MHTHTLDMNWAVLRVWCIQRRAASCAHKYKWSRGAAASKGIRFEQISHVTGCRQTYWRTIILTWRIKRITWRLGRGRSYL